MKLEKKQVRSLVALAAVLVVYNVLAFVIPFEHTSVFWVAYSFGLISMAAAIAILVLAFGKTENAKSKFYGFPIARIGIIYAAIQIPLSFIAMVLALISSMPVWPFVLVFILLLAAAILGTVATDATRDEIERQDAASKRNVAKMRALQSFAKGLVSQCSDDAVRKELTKLSDQLQFSDPVSSDATEEPESRLTDLLDELQRSLRDGDNEGAKALCKKSMEVLAERNRLCKLNK